MASETEETPRRPLNDETTLSAFSSLTMIDRYKVERRKEYASRLRPIKDENLPPALHYPDSQLGSDDRPPSLLYFGFQFPPPDGLPSIGKVIDEIAKKIGEVNNAVGRPQTLREVGVVTDCPAEIVVVAVYSNARKKSRVHTQERINRIAQELRKVFGNGVEGPMWYWDLYRHGAEGHQYRPFDEAYPNGHPAEC